MVLRYGSGRQILIYGVLLSAFASGLFAFAVPYAKQDVYWQLGLVLFAPYIIAAAGTWVVNKPQRHLMWACSQVVLTLGYILPVIAILALASNSPAVVLAILPLGSQYFCALVILVVIIAVLGRRAVLRFFPRPDGVSAERED
jgi:hypothetical protein